MEEENEHEYSSSHPPIAERIRTRLDNDVIHFEFEKYFADAWRIFKQVCLPILGASILIGLPIFIIYIILLPVLGGEEVYRYQVQPGERVDFFEIMKQSQARTTPVMYLKQSVLSFISVLFTAPLQAGFLLGCREADKDGGVYFGSLFKFYKSRYTGRIIAASLILTLAGIVFGFGFSFLPVIGPLLNLLVVLFLYLGFSFVTPLIIFGNASLGEAISLSFKMTFRKFGPVLGYTLMFGFLAMCGFIVCCIGVILTFAFIIVNNYLLYKHIAGFPEDDQPKPDEEHWLQRPPEI